MDRTNHRFKVVRYYAHPGHGTIEETLGRGLSMIEAEALADSEAPVTSDERVAIQDENEVGLDSFVRIDRRVDREE